MDETTPKKREITDIYRTTFDHAPVGIAHVAPDGRLLMVNDRFCDIVGHQRTDLLARGFQDITFPEDLEPDLAQAQRLLDGEIDSYDMEKRYVRSNGATVWANLTVSLQRHPDGAPYHFIAVIEDISTRKAAEQQLLLTQFSTEHSSDATYWIDPQGHFFYVNEAACAATGFSREELLQMSVHDLDTEYPISAWSAHWQQLRDQKTLTFESCHRAKTGEVFEVEVNANHLQFGERELNCASVRDITARKRAEAALQARVQQQAAVAELGLLAIAERDLDALLETATILLAETLAVEFTKVLELLPDGGALLLRAGVGWKEGLVGTARVGTGEDSQAGYTLKVEEPIIVRDLATESRFSGPTLLTDHGVVSGMSVVIHGRCRPFGVLGVHSKQDVYFTRDDANFLQAVANIIADAVQVRHVQSDREHLIAELERKNIELEKFAFTVSHDLKSPLITVQGFLGLLREDLERQDFEQARADIDHLVDASGHMQRLLDELLELSRIGRVTNPPQEVSLHQIATTAAELLAGQIAEKKAEVEIASELPVIMGDYQRLLQVMQNLMENALKFMGEQPKPHISIGATFANQEVACFIRDNGIGIDAEDHKRVLDLFHRLDPDSQGTGIGLPLVNRIIQVHGGRLWIESEGKGRGTTVWFSLPDNGNGNGLEAAENDA